MDTALKRQELINWLQTVEDFNLLMEVEKIKIQKTKKLYTLDEARKISLSKIEKWKEK